MGWKLVWEKKWWFCAIELNLGCGSCIEWILSMVWSVPRLAAFCRIPVPSMRGRCGAMAAKPPPLAAARINRVSEWKHNGDEIEEI